MEENLLQRKKRRAKKLFTFLIFLLIIHIILVLSTCTTIKQEEVKKSVPYITGVEEETTFKNCGLKDYEWSYAWGELIIGEKTVSTTFRIINLEDRGGNFAIDFAFFDEQKYHFDDYRGINYDLVRNRLLWNSASMHTPTFKIYLSSKESKDLLPVADKKDQNASYWIYADVKTDKIEKCEEIKRMAVINKTEEKNITELASITEKKNLWRILLEKLGFI